MIFGPACNAITGAMDVTIGGFRIDSGNAPGLLIALLMLVELLLLVTCVPEPPAYAKPSEAAGRFQIGANQTRARSNQTRAPSYQTQASFNQTRAPSNQIRAPSNQTRAPSNQTRALPNQTRASNTGTFQSNTGIKHGHVRTIHGPPRSWLMGRQPSVRTPPHGPPWPTWRRRALLRSPERSPGRSEASSGPTHPTLAALDVSTTGGGRRRRGLAPRLALRTHLVAEVRVARQYSSSIVVV
jgi:hypothetical protein